VKAFTAEVQVTSRIENQVNPLLFGDNIEWTNHGMGLWLPQQKAFDEPILQLLAPLQLTHLRYPGGTLSDFFHWRSSVGGERKPILNPFADKEKGKLEYPDFGVDEFFKLCKRLHLKATLTLNAGTGTPEEAAEFVRYCLNKPEVQIASFTVGNEIYMARGEDEPVQQVPIGKTPEEYVAFYERTRALCSPLPKGVLFGAIGLLNEPTFPMNRYPGWQKTIISRLGDKMDFLDVHDGYAPGLRRFPGKPVLSDEEFAEAFLAAPLAVQRNLEATLQQLDRYAPPGRKGKIGLTLSEYGPLVYPIDSAHALEDVAWNRNVIAALYLASLFHVLTAQPRLLAANHLPLCQDVFGALIGYRLLPEGGRKVWRNAEYHVFRLYASLAGYSRLATQVQSPVFSVKQVGLVPAMQAVPLVDCAAYRSLDSRLLVCTLVNRDLHRVCRVQLSPPRPGFHVEKALCLGGGDWRAENTPDAPDTVTFKPFEVASRKATKAGENLQLDLPPASLVVLYLRRDFSQAR